jgi:RNA polymerase sigma-70 factor (ECF subfamily)
MINILIVQKRGVNMNDIVIIKKAQKGDDEAFSELIDSCQEKLYKIAFAYLKNEQNSLDAVGDTIYKAYMNISKLKIPEFFNTWIIKILINSCKDIFD